MGTPIEDIRRLSVPAEDDALRSAVAELDQKLSEYAAAVRALSAQVRPGAVHPEIAAIEPAPAMVEPSPTAVQPPAAPAEASAAPQVGKRLASRLSGRPSPKTDAPAGDVESPGQPRPPAVEPQAAAAPSHTEESEPAPDLTEPQVPAADEPSTAPVSEEEALLATLDEPIAKAVRIMRRLNSHKPIQELVEQAQKHVADQPAKTATKAWFRFGR